VKGTVPLGIDDAGPLAAGRCCAPPLPAVKTAFLSSVTHGEACAGEIG
jgi:hypothetical protein